MTLTLQCKTVQYRLQIFQKFNWELWHSTASEKDGRNQFGKKSHVLVWGFQLWVKPLPYCLNMIIDYKHQWIFLFLGIHGVMKLNVLFDTCDFWPLISRIFTLSSQNIQVRSKSMTQKIISLMCQPSLLYYGAIHK